MRKRLCAGFLLAAMVTLSAAQWTVTVLHPTMKDESQVYGISPTTQVGYTILTGNFHASVWSGTMASWVDLHPQSAELSVATGVSGLFQAGYALTGSGYRASLWSGTPESWQSIHPAGTSESVIHGASASYQVGYTKISSRYRAAMWSGTAGSWVDLDPPASLGSTAMAVWEGPSGSSQVGVATVGVDQHASLWHGTAASWVDLNPDGMIASIAYAAYGNLQAGSTTPFDVEHATIWAGSADAWIDLNPSGASESVAFGILGNFEVGYAKFAGLKHAGMWSGSAESWTDLHGQLSADYDSSVARSICTDGIYDYVGGYGHNTVTHKTEALLWKRPSVISDGFSLTLNKLVVAGQNSVQGTITPTVVSPVARTYTTYDDSSLVNTPTSVVLPANGTVKNFQITVLAVNSPINTTIYAKRGGVIRSQPLTLAPLVPTALAFTPNPVTGGQDTLARIVINGVAGPGGRTIATFDNSAFATTPNSVIVPAGGSSVTFTIATLPVTSSRTVTVTARVSAGEKTGNFRINP